MPLLELRTTYSDREAAVNKLTAQAELMKDVVQSNTTDAIEWSPTPAFQEDGDVLILRWKYKQYKT